MTIDQATVFRVTRNSEYEIDDDEVEDLLKTIEEEVRKRRRGAAVRLEIEADAPPEVEQFLMTSLDLEPIDVYPTPGLLDLTGLFQIYGLPGYPHLRDPQFVPQPVPEFASAASPWPAIRARDILVHHPYESFAPSSISSRRRPATSACWPSSRRSTAPQRFADRPGACSGPPTTASR